MVTEVYSGMGEAGGMTDGDEATYCTAVRTIHPVLREAKLLS